MSYEADVSVASGLPPLNKENDLVPKENILFAKENDLAPKENDVVLKETVLLVRCNWNTGKMVCPTDPGQNHDPETVVGVRFGSELEWFCFERE